MEQKKELAIVIITYNVSNLISKQIECIRRFCKDDFTIIVIDNSDNEETAEAIKYYCAQSHVQHFKTQATSKNGSDSHMFACNFSYSQFYEQFKYYLYLDHDNFPVKDFSVKEILKDKVMGGIGQIKPSGKTYFWAGCVMWDDEKIEKGLIDFSVSHQLGLDTGGMLYKVVEKYGEDACVFFNEIYHENPYFKSVQYNHYTIIQGIFMHFVNSSNWNPLENNTERVNSLLNVLEDRLK